MIEEGQTHSSRPADVSCSKGVCAEQRALQKQQGGREGLPSGPDEDDGTVPGDPGLCSTLLGKADDIMPVLPLPNPREARGSRPETCRGTEGP